MSVIPEKIKITEVELLEFSVKGQDEPVSSFKHVPNLEIGLQHHLSQEDKILTFLYEGKLDLKNEKQETFYESRFKFKFIIYVENLEDFKTGEGDAEKYDSIIALTCIGITYSTLRGILFSKLLGTPLEHFILPVLDPKTLVG